MSAYRIKEGDFESWHKEWLNTAQRVHKYAVDSLAAGHKVSARQIALRIITEYNSYQAVLSTTELATKGRDAE